MVLVKINTPVHYHVKKYRICKNKICQGPGTLFDGNMVVSAGMAHIENKLPSNVGGTVVEWVRALAWNGDRTFRPGSNLTTVKTFRFGTLAIPFTPLCQCLSDETLEAVGPFYLVSARGSKRSHQSAQEMSNCRGLHLPL